MRIPAIKGLIDRRVLVNYRVDRDVMAHILPPPFRPKTVRGFAIGSIRYANKWSVMMFGTAKAQIDEYLFRPNERRI